MKELIIHNVISCTLKIQMVRYNGCRCFIDLVRAVDIITHCSKINFAVYCV